MKLKPLIRFLFVSLLVIFSLTIPNYYRLWAKPYRLTKSNLQIPFSPKWEVAISEEKKAECLSILSQPFAYLGKGFQSYAFLSADEKYVLKLFRLDPCKLKVGQSFFDFCKRKFGKKVRFIQEVSLRAENMFHASKVTFDSLQDETGLLLVHLNPGSTNWPLIEIKDYLGFTHFVDPSLTRFVLQKKADKIFPALARAWREDRESFGRMISSFSSLLAAFEAKGVFIGDSKMPSNFGFLGEHAIQIDFASNSDQFNGVPQQTQKFQSKLRSWIQSKASDEPK